MITQGIIKLGVQELMPGMIISEDVISNGIVLLRKGRVISQPIINLLQNIYFMDEVQVFVPADVIGDNIKKVEIKKAEQTFQEVADDLKKLSSKIDSLNESSISDLKRFAFKIEGQLRDSDIVLSTVLFKGDNGDYIYKHGVNVAVLSALLGKWLGFDQNKVNLLIYAALLHDFGITKLKDELQKQPDLITDKNNDEVKEHVHIAYDSIKSLKNLDKSVICGVLMHHERCDGSGYPLGIGEEKIHPFAKIIAIADEFDTLNSNKELVGSAGIFHSLKEIKEMSLKYLDYNYSKTFLEHIFNFYIGEKVQLSNGDVAKVLNINMEDIEKPLLFNGEEFIDLKKNKDIYIKMLVI